MAIEIKNRAVTTAVASKLCVYNGGTQGNTPPVPDIQIRCDDASSMVVLKNQGNYLDLNANGYPPVMDVYINSKLVKSNTSMYIYDISGYLATLQDLYDEYHFNASSNSDNRLTIYNEGGDDLRIMFVPRKDGEYGGEIIDKKFLILASETYNNSVNFDEDTGIVTFCLTSIEN